MVERDVVTVELPPLAAHALRQYARRVELDVETLLLEALREASWFRDAARSSFPLEILGGPGSRP